MEIEGLRHICIDSPSISSDMLNSAALEAFAPERCLRGTMSSPLPIKPRLVAIGGSFRGTTFAFDEEET